MAKKILKFPQQLELPLIWWRDIDLWREREHISNIKRPTEDEALTNIYNQARAYSGKLKTRLDPIEKKVYALELRSFQECPRYFNEAERRVWVSKKAGIGIQAVKDILRNVDIFTVHQSLLVDIKRVQELDNVAQQIPVSQKIYMGLVVEVMKEEKSAA